MRNEKSILASLPLMVLFVLFSTVVSAQEQRRIGIQTNAFSLLRPTMPSLNVGLMIEDGLKQYLIETDVIGYIVNDFSVSEDYLRMNSFYTRNRIFRSFDFSGGIHWFLNEEKQAYFGLRAHLGYFAFSHNQLLCIDAQNVNGICMCNELEDYTFNTYQLRYGGHVRFGLVLPINEKNEIEMSLDLGFFGFSRRNTDALRAHDICDNVTTRETDENVSVLQAYFTNGLLYFDRVVQPSFRLNLVYRFILSDKTY
ncbi:MAG: DUF3575 domain-containing protein [Cryomorphaceae bacterium]|nr:DUF3575 domain-containing protein [Cryomorphaceae bacterium]